MYIRHGRIIIKLILLNTANRSTTIRIIIITTIDTKPINNLIISKLSRNSQSRLPGSPGHGGSKHESSYVSSRARQTHRGKVISLTSLIFLIFFFIRNRTSPSCLLVLRFVLFSQIPAVSDSSRGHDARAPPAATD